MCVNVGTKFCCGMCCSSSSLSSRDQAAVDPAAHTGHQRHLQRHTVMLKPIVDMEVVGPKYIVRCLLTGLRLPRHRTPHHGLVDMDSINQVQPDREMIALRRGLNLHRIPRSYLTRVFVIAFTLVYVFRHCCSLYYCEQLILTGFIQLKWLLKTYLLGHRDCTL